MTRDRVIEILKAERECTSEVLEAYTLAIDIIQQVPRTISEDRYGEGLRDGMRIERRRILQQIHEWQGSGENKMAMGVKFLLDRIEG